MASVGDGLTQVVNPGGVYVCLVETVTWLYFGLSVYSITTYPTNQLTDI